MIMMKGNLAIRGIVADRGTRRTEHRGDVRTPVRAHLQAMRYQKRHSSSTVNPGTC